MKNFSKYVSVLLMVLAMGLVSCGSDDSSDSKDDNPIQTDVNEVKFTTWKDTHNYSDGTKVTYTLKFGSSTAVYELAVTEGTQTVTETMNYTFTRADNLVILNPSEAGKATLEGRIENGIRMSITNASNGSEIAVLYKQ